ncbi:putative spermidine synthase [Calothrix sp. NIES-4071]|nr:putative spermidine synthase [Calothrix sp. NIES-4071]BAZ56969.1 putative spermidine synthase [Calothrix sp. NIES-4105]
MSSANIDWKFNRLERIVLLLIAAITSVCGLATELLLGNLASYLVGNQALSYGISVGGFLAAMGFGAYLSRFIAVRETPQLLLKRLAQIELAIAPLSTFFPLILFTLFIFNAPFWIALFSATLILGTLAGLEVPLLTRLLEKDEETHNALSGVLALDYLGALIGSLAFPVLLLPHFGIFTSSVFIGILQASMVYILGLVFRGIRIWRQLGLFTCALLCFTGPIIVPLTNRLEAMQYRDPVVTSLQTPLHRIVLTQNPNGMSLFVNGSLQMSTQDEYYYNELLVHPAMSAALEPRQVLLMGLGDGMALREVLKWSDVQRVVLIASDEALTRLAISHPLLGAANQNALSDPRVKIVYKEAFSALANLHQTFDVIVADFPDPTDESTAKLYTQGFYQRVRARLSPKGILVTPAAEKTQTRVLDCIVETLKSVHLKTYPYIATLPNASRNFVLASPQELHLDEILLSVSTRFLTPQQLARLFHDASALAMKHRPQAVEINRLSRLVILNYQTGASTI